VQNLSSNDLVNMRCIVILVLACCLSFTSARSGVKRSKYPPGHSEPESDDISPDSPEQLHAVKRHHESGHDVSDHDDSAPSDRQVCEARFIPCASLMAPYLASENTAEVLRNTPLGTQCSLAVDIRDCLREAIESQECTAEFDEDDERMLKLLSLFSGVITFVCEDNLEEFEKHETCLRSLMFDQGVEECRVANLEDDRCNPNKFIACTDKSIDAAPECATDTEGAKELVNAFITEFLTYVPECEVPGMKFIEKVMLLKMRKIK